MLGELTSCNERGNGDNSRLQAFYFCCKIGHVAIARVYGAKSENPLINLLTYLLEAMANILGVTVEQIDILTTSLCSTHKPLVKNKLECGYIYIFISNKSF